MRAILWFGKTTLTYLNVVAFRQMPRSYNFSNVLNFDEVIFKYFPRISFHTSCVSVLNKDVVRTNVNNEQSKNEGAVKPEKKKKEKQTYITLLENDLVNVMTLEDATKLALRRNLKLIRTKEYDTKSDRATYKLMTTAQYLADEKKSKVKSGKSNSSVKGVKLLSVSSKINDHDVQAKIKNMIKWLDKQYEVRVVISNDNGEAENVYNKVAEGIKECGRVVQKRVKGLDLKFGVLPPKKTKENESSNVSSGVDDKSKLES